MNRKVKNIGLIIFTIIFLSLQTKVYAANNIESIDIDAAINKDGSMEIVQVWSGNFDEDTELYIPMLLSSDNEVNIRDYNVSDINGTYEIIDNWDTSKSFEEKANKAGILTTDDGYEICFGISNYGQNTYILKYTLDNVINSYSDVDGVNFKFVNDNMNTTPTNVDVKIRLYDGCLITDEVADIWAFGYDGEVVFDYGAIHGYTETPITEYDYVTIMFSFEKGILEPIIKNDYSFESVKEAAFEDSDYTELSDEGSLIAAIILLLIIYGTPFLFFWGIFKLFKIRRKGKIKKFINSVDYFKKVPNRGKLNVTYVLCKQFGLCNKEDILKVGLLSLMNANYLEPIIEENSGMFGNKKESLGLKVIRRRGTKRISITDEMLYNMLKRAANEDGILNKKELKRFTIIYKEIIKGYIQTCENEGKAYLTENKCMYDFSIPAKIKYLEPNGKKEMAEIFGFKKYLENFSLISESGIEKLPIWKEMLMYGMLFGIADKLAKQMKEIYPHLTNEINNYRVYIDTASIYHNSMSGTLNKVERSGSGGGSSSGGGSGSSGGGSGGGSR